MADEIECPYCGHTLNVEVTAGVECPHCGATIGPEQTDEVVCPHCEAVLLIYADDFDIGKEEEVECWDCKKLYYITKRSVKDFFDFDISRR